ncbi:Kappa-casein [Heterocephalus glaber]|uniref:Kappa-casein n=1 Tax=Heterocephalus glaber TaxID=10181 RepID=G5AYC4_HETGA|nr:kappa-casein [Heterocephalus glaber]EHB02035.1 Kappa-casein [Heterocephalus glaber]
MKRFLLVVNILALAVPFLAAEVPNQEQSACCENDERLFNQKKVLYILSHPVLNNYLHNARNYYQNRAVVPINNPYKCDPYYAQSFVFRPQAPIPQWSVLTNAHQFTMLHRPTKYPSFMVIPARKIPEEAAIPTTDTMATLEPTPVPVAEPATNTADFSGASAKFVHTPETSTVPATSPMA